MSKPVVLDLCCGLGGWSHGFIAEGWHAIGFDIERHEYGDKRYPGELILADILTLNGYDLRAANPSMIVASPPCQEYSYMAMPWKRGKQIAAALRGDDRFPEGYDGSRTLRQLTALFRACLRIARECGVPIVLENVKGAQPWVGRAKANYGSYYLWGDVANVGGRVVRPDALAFGMPAVKAQRLLKQPGRNFHFPEKYGIPSPSFHGADHEESVKDALALKTVGHANIRDGHSHTRHLTNQAESDALKVPGMSSWSDYGKPGYKPQGFNVTAAQRYRAEHADVTGTKVSGDWFGSYAEQKAAGTISPGRMHGKNSDSRKAASALIAEIPFDLASHIARVFKP